MRTAEIVATDTPGDTPTVLLTPAASLPSAAVFQTGLRSCSWNAEEDAKLLEAIKKHGTNSWIALAKLVPPVERIYSVLDAGSVN
jgi:hypothetical protein